ncbi:hypothetical protein Bbelb_221070 [Branchiostoma belcheri]|nr:hypothetical protein Bbelb_221070 [Branchiostoma belcheri]
MDLRDQNVILSSGLQRARPDVPPPRRKEQADGRNEDSSSGDRVPPPIPPRARPVPPNTYEDVDPHGESIFAPTPGQETQDDEEHGTTSVPPPFPPRDYEDVDPHGYRVFIPISALSEPPSSPIDTAEKDKKPPSSPIDTGEKEKKPPPGHHTEKKELAQEAGQNYEDMGEGSVGENVILQSALKRAVPDLPPPRKRDKKDKASKRKKEEEEEEQVGPEEEDSRESAYSYRHLDVGDHMVVWQENNEEPHIYNTDIYYTAKNL